MRPPLGGRRILRPGQGQGSLVDVPSTARALKSPQSAAKAARAPRRLDGPTGHHGGSKAWATAREQQGEGTRADARCTQALRKQGRLKNRRDSLHRPRPSQRLCQTPRPGGNTIRLLCNFGPRRSHVLHREIDRLHLRIHQLDRPSGGPHHAINSVEPLLALLTALERAVLHDSRFSEGLRQLLDFFATTEKPRPASPARAASIAAFRANRLVWCAIALIMVVAL